MHTDINEYRKYQAKWHREYRKKHAEDVKRKAKERYMRLCKRCHKAKEDLLFHMRGGVPIGWCLDCCAKYQKVYQRKHKAINDGSPRCSICEIKIGDKYENKISYIYKNKKICGWCWEELLKECKLV